MSQLSFIYPKVMEQEATLSLDSAMDMELVIFTVNINIPEECLILFIVFFFTSNEIQL